MILALLAAGATLALRAPFSHANVQGFVEGGKTALFGAAIDAPTEDGDGYLWAERVWVAIADDGRPLHLARHREDRAEGVDEDEIEVSRDGKSLWEAAEDEEQGNRLGAEARGAADTFLGSTRALPPGAGKARLEESGPRSCPAERLYVSLAGVEALAFEDPCPGGAAKKPPRTTLAYAWNASGSALALAWGVQRRAPRAYLAVLTARNLAAIDLLGGGDAEAEALAAAGFRVVHRAAAVKARSDTAVYFAPGFQAEAEAVAQALGAPASAAQPLSWKTPYAVTVAPGANPATMRR